MGAMDTCRNHDVTYPADSGGFDRCPMCALEDRVKLLDAVADAALQANNRYWITPRGSVNGEMSRLNEALQALDDFDGPTKGEE